MLLADWSTDYEYDAEGNRTRKREIPILAAGADNGGPHVRIYDPQTGAVRGEFYAYDVSFGGGVRVAVGDVNGDGVHDIVTVQGANTDPNQPTEVRIFHGADGTLLGSFDALGFWSGGAFIAAGDVTGDGLADLITSQGANGDPTQPTQVRLFRGTDRALLARFDALGAWAGGASVAAGDMNGDGRADIYVGADEGGGPHVRVYDGADLTGQTMLRDFHAYDPLFSGGVRVGAADVDRDGRADLVTTQGPNPDPAQPTEVRIYSGASGALLASYDGFGAWTGGAYIAGNGQEALEDVSYQWDHRNRLTSVTYHKADGSPSKVVEYDYDVYDRLIAKRVDDNGDGTFDRAERMVYDGGDVVLVFDDTGSLTNRSLHGPAVDQLFADENALGEVMWALADNQGTVRDEAAYDAATGTTSVTNHIRYDSFGRITSESDPSGDSRLIARYTGRYYDPDTDLINHRARWSTMDGRWLNPDPSGFRDGTNRYTYTGNSPVNFTDPSGLARYGLQIDHPDASQIQSLLARGAALERQIRQLNRMATNELCGSWFGSDMDRVNALTRRVIELTQQLGQLRQAYSEAGYDDVDVTVSTEFIEGRGVVDDTASGFDAVIDIMLDFGGLDAVNGIQPTGDEMLLFVPLGGAAARCAARRAAGGLADDAVPRGSPAPTAPGTNPSQPIVPGFRPDGSYVRPDGTIQPPPVIGTLSPSPPPSWRPDPSWPTAPRPLPPGHFPRWRPRPGDGGSLMPPGQRPWNPPPMTN